MNPSALVQTPWIPCDANRGDDMSHDDSEEQFTCLRFLELPDESSRTLLR